MPILNEDAADYGRLADELKTAWQIAKKFEPAIRAKLAAKKLAGADPLIGQKITGILNAYQDSIVRNVQAGLDTDETRKPDNLYELVGAKRLAASNNLSRAVSTELGSAWERIASLSHLAVNPELDFNTKIAGVDLIILSGDRLRHTQIKTQKNTLTGSQKPRSVAELKMYDYPLFAAAFDVANWTFSSTEIERVAGRGFWSLLEIDYDLVVRSAQTCLLAIEKRLLGAQLGRTARTSCRI